MSNEVALNIIALDSASEILRGIGDVFIELGRTGIEALKGITDVMIDLAKEGMEDQDVMARFNSLVDSSPLKEFKGEMLGLADATMQHTRFTHDDIIAAEAQLSVYTNIGENIFPDVLKATTNLATFMRTDATQAAQVMGRAFEDIGNGSLNMLYRQKLLTDAQRDTAVAMAQGGDAAGAQAYVIGILNDKIGNLAEDMSKTSGGQLDKLKNKFEEIREDVGLKLIPIFDDLLQRVLVPMMPLIEGLGKNFGDFITKIANSKEFSSLLNDMEYGLMHILETLNKLVTGDFKIQIPKIDLSQVFGSTPATPDLSVTSPADVKNPFQTLFDWITQHKDEMLTNLKEIGDSLLNAGKGVAEAMKPGVMDLWNTFSNWLKENDPLIRKFGDTLSSWLAHEVIPDLQLAFQVFWNFTEPILKGLEGMVLNLASAFMQLVTGDWKGALESIGKAGFEFDKGEFDAAKSIVNFLGMMSQSTGKGGAEGILSGAAFSGTGAASGAIGAPGTANNITINVPVTYAPTVSAGNQAEIQANLVPIINTALRDQLRNLGITPR